VLNKTKTFAKHVFSNRSASDPVFYILFFQFKPDNRLFFPKLQKQNSWLMVYIIYQANQVNAMEL